MPYITVQIARTQPLSESQTQQLVQVITDVMVQTLHKKRHLVAVSLAYVPSEQWFIAAQPLAEASAFIQAYITDGTNSEAEKAQAIAELYNLLQSVLGSVEEATYIVLNNMPATNWGYAGKTQASRYLAPKSLPADQYRMYVNRAHKLQNAEFKTYFLKLIDLIKHVFKRLLVNPLLKCKAGFPSQANLAGQLKPY